MPKEQLPEVKDLELDSTYVVPPDSASRILLRYVIVRMTNRKYAIGRYECRVWACREDGSLPSQDEEGLLRGLGFAIITKNAPWTTCCQKLSELLRQIAQKEKEKEERKKQPPRYPGSVI